MSNEIKWLFKDPHQATLEQALRIVCRVLQDTDAAHIAMALRHRPKYPDQPAGHCGLTQWIKKVLKANAPVQARALPSPTPVCSARRICKECGQVWLRCVKCGRDLPPDEFAVRYEGTSTGNCIECTFDGVPSSKGVTP